MPKNENWMENIKTIPYTIVYNCKGSKIPVHTKINFNKDTRTYRVIVQKTNDSKRTIETDNLIDMIKEIKSFANVKPLPFYSPYTKYLLSEDEGNFHNYTNEDPPPVPETSKKKFNNND